MKSRDYPEYSAEIAASQNIKEQDYWLNKLSGELVNSTFPYDYKEIAANKRQMHTVSFEFDHELYSRLKEICKGSDLRMYITLLTGLVLLLYKYTGHRDITVGSPIQQQNQEGEFINTVLVLKNSLDKNMTFKELLLQVSHTVYEAAQHQNYPIRILLEKLNIDFSEENNFPLFETTILLENIQEKKYIDHLKTNVNFSFKYTGTIEGTIEYNSFIYKETTIRRIITHYTYLFQSALFNVNTPIIHLDILPEAEKEQILFEFNSTLSQAPTVKTVHQLFEEQASKMPDQIAVCSHPDLQGIYNWLELETGSRNQFEDISPCCFKKNPYIHNRKLKLGSGNTLFLLLKTHRHNGVVINSNLSKLLDLFDGQRNISWVFSSLKGTGGTFLIYPVKRNDLLEIAFDFNIKPQRFSADRKEDFYNLIRLLYKNHLIELSGINTNQTVPGRNLPGPDLFEADDTWDGGTINPTLKELLEQDQQMTGAGVLLLGDTPGMPTTGILYMASYLRRNSIQAVCQFYDPALDYSSLGKNIEQLLARLRPPVVAVSLKWFLYIERVFEICRLVKGYAARHDLDIKVVVGGNTASYYWRDIIKNDFIDYVVRGDGEVPLLKICQQPDNPERIPNIAYKSSQNNELLVENPMTYIQDETDSPGIYLSHLDEILLSRCASLWGIFYIYTHKGCDMKCLYCGGCNQAQQKTFKRKKVFRRGVEEVRKDILAAKPYASTFQFDFYIPRAQWVEYCKKIWEGIDLSNHFCIFSGLTLPPAPLIELARHTFKYVYCDIDITTLSERHREQLASLGLVKPQPGDKEILALFDLCEPYGNIDIRINLITGLPYFKEEDIEPGEQLLTHIMNNYTCFGELHWARLHAEPGANVVENAQNYNMHSYATQFEDFWEYSKKNFNNQTSHSSLESLNYPYIYFNDDQLNSMVTLFYSENNLKIRQYNENKRHSLTVSEYLSYRDLHKKTDQLAAHLAGKGVIPGSIVGLLLEPSIDIVIGILGILKTGAAYLPIDPDFPVKRIEYMLKDSSLRHLVTQPHLADRVVFEGKILDIQEKSIYKTGAIAPQRIEIGCPADIVYIIYTSGTTGKSKGVALKHESLVNYVRWFTREINLTEADKSILTSSFAFDLGYTVLFPPLLKGAVCYILPREIYLSPEKLLRYIKDNEITYIKMTPSLFAAIVNHPEFSACSRPKLRFAIIGGEAINVIDIEKAHEKCTHLQIMNHYGPTEATIGSVARLLDFDCFEEYKNIPTIGTPIDNTRVYILDKEKNLLPIGVPGELCLAGNCLAPGYLNAPELTAGKFDQGLLDYQDYRDKRKKSPGKRISRYNRPHRSPGSYILYKSGDLARWLEDGNIEFLGRIDQQVKIRGYRIELGEIENRLSAHPKVQDTVVITKENPGGEKYICAYVVQAKQQAGKKEVEMKEQESGTPETAQSPVESFEHWVRENPGKIALKTRSRDITYAALNRCANQLSRSIEEKYDDRYSLSEKEKTRYKRQMVLADWGMASQEKLKSTTVFVGGAGGGASPTITQLALAGFGTIIVCDCDTVELSNLNRQFLHDESRLGMNKALSAKITIERINPNVNVVAHTERLTRENAFEMLGEADVIFDMFDGLESKFILSECAVVRQIPHIISAMTDINAYCVVFHTPFTPCFHCLFDKNKFESITRGMKSIVRGYEKNPLPVMSTSLFISTGFAVNEATKIILGFEKPAYNRFFYFNQRPSDRLIDTEGYQAMTHTFSSHFFNICKEQGFDWKVGWRDRFLEELIIKPDPQCLLCGKNSKEIKQTIKKRMKKASPPASPGQNHCEDENNNNNQPNKKNKRVALLLTEHVYMAAALLGTLKSGGTYVILNSHLPEKELIKTLEDQQVRIIIADSSGLKLAEKVRNKVNKNIHIINVNDIKLDDADDPSPGEAVKIKCSPLPPGEIPQTFPGNYAALLTGGTCNLANAGLEQESWPSLVSELGDYLLKELPPYMNPRHFVQLDSLPLTPNGKLNRKALPEPGAVDKGEINLPKDEVEKKVAEIWADVLEIESNMIGTDSNFFQLGGHSLKATILVSRLHKEFNVEVTLNQVLTEPTIHALAAFIKTSKRSIYEGIKTLEKKEYYPLSSNQQRLYILQQIQPRSPVFNMPGTIEIKHEVDEKLVKKVLTHLTRRHESLRTAFKIVEDQPCQFVVKEMDIPLESIDLAMMAPGEKESQQDQVYKRIAAVPFDLFQAPLFRSALVKLAPDSYQLIFNMHHIISDGWSLEILTREFFQLYNGYKEGRDLQLPALTIKYRDFVIWHNRQVNGPHGKKALQYWKDKLTNGVPVLLLPADWEIEKEDNIGAQYRWRINKQTLNQLKKLAETRQITLFTLMFSIYILFLTRICSQEEIVCSIIAAGRDHPSLPHIIGFFVNSVIFTTRVDKRQTFGEFLETLNREVIDVLHHQSYPLETVFEDLGTRYPEIPVSFNMINIGDTAQTNILESFAPQHMEKAQDVKFNLEVYITEHSNGIDMNWAYKKNMFEPNTIVQMTKEYVKQLEFFVRHPDQSLKDYLSAGKKQRTGRFKKKKGE